MHPKARVLEKLCHTFPLGILIAVCQYIVMVSKIPVYVKFEAAGGHI